MAEQTVLILDDEPEMLRFFTSVIESAGYKTIGVQNGSEALKATRANRPDLAVVDLGVPGLSGVQFITVLKRDWSVRTPVLVVTGRTSERDRQEAMVAGADRLLTKPVLREDLLAAVRELLAHPPPADE